MKSHQMEEQKALMKKKSRNEDKSRANDRSHLSSLIQSTGRRFDHQASTSGVSSSVTDPRQQSGVSVSRSFASDSSEEEEEEQQQQPTPIHRTPANCSANSISDPRRRSSIERSQAASGSQSGAANQSYCDDWRCCHSRGEREVLFDDHCKYSAQFSDQSGPTTPILASTKKRRHCGIGSKTESQLRRQRAQCCCCCSWRKNPHNCYCSSHSHNQTTGDMSQTSDQLVRLIPAYFIAELVGTFLLVLIGDGAIGAYVLIHQKVDIFVACFAFGVGAMIASYASGKISGAHINPAASLAFALDGRLKWSLVPIYMLAQYVGGFLAALLLFINYSEAINAIDGGQHSAFGAANSTGGIFATYPAPYLSIWGSLLDQIVGTAVLMFALSAVCDKNNGAPDERTQPLLISLTVGLICVAFSPNCGAIFNPARDLPPRLVTALFGYPSVWSPLQGTYWLLAGILGPHLGAIVGVFGYKYLIGCSLAASQRALKRTSESPANLDNNSDDFVQKHSQSLAATAFGRHTDLGS